MCTKRAGGDTRAEQNALLRRLRERLAHMELTDNGGAAERLLRV